VCAERWSDPRNRRKFFEEFARERGFDPLKAEHWYSQPLLRSRIRAAAGGLLKYHGKSMAQALIELFPEVHFDGSRFDTIKLEHKKHIFLEFAKRSGFDPLNPLNWAAQSREKLSKLADGIYLRGHFNGDVVKLLLCLFPNIGLVPSMFKTIGKWYTAEQRKAFFEKYANDNSFDALNAENWYQHRLKISAQKQRFFGILHYHSHSVAQALVELFPNVEFDKSRLS